jgi:hypothetical protein
MMNTSIALEGRPNSTIAMTVAPSPSPSHSGHSSPGTSASTLILVACIALLGVLVTTLVQWVIGRRTIRVNSATATGIAEQAKANAFAKRYQDAAKQLGHDKAPVRLAGVYAMARLADDWDDQRQTCVDVLCAYLRMPFPPDTIPVPSDSDNTQELQVRIAAQRLLEDHFRINLEGEQSLGKARRMPLLPPDPPIESIAAIKVVVFSHDADVRAQMRLAIGRRPAPDVPEAEIIEVATEPALFRLLDAGGTDVMVLDGEAQPAGGMGICRQAKDEIYNCPPVLLVIGRPDDAWLATWSRADAVVSHPIDPSALARALAGLMRDREKARL